MKNIIFTLQKIDIKKVFCIVLILSPPLSILYFIHVYGYKVPYWDQWIFSAVFLEKAYAGKLTFLDFWAQHNEHRILFPRVIMLALAYLTNWNIMYELYMNFFLASLTLLFLYSLYRRSIGNPIPLWLVAALSFLVFSIVQWENWIWGWQIQIFLNVLMTVVAVWAIVRWPKHIKGVLIAVCAAIVASYSFINGLLTWISVGMLLFTKSQREKRHIALWITFFALTIISYYYGYTKPAHHPSLLRFVSHIGDYIKYVLAYLGASLGFINKNFLIYQKASIIVTLVLLVLMFVSAILIRRLNKNDVRLLPWFSLALYSLLSAAATGVGRIGLGIDQALISRYTTISTLFVISSVVIASVSLKSLLNKYKSLTAKMIVASISFLFIGAYALTSLNAKQLLIERSLSVKSASPCLQNADIATDDCLKVLFPDTELIREQTKLLKKLGLIKGFNHSEIDKVKGGLM